MVESNIARVVPIAALLFLAVTVSVQAQNGRVSEWERAAINRERAAETQAVEAEVLIDRAAEVREAEVLRESERVQGRRKAGALELAAGDLFGKAHANFNRAVADWKKAQAHYASIKSSGNERESELRMETTKVETMRSCRLAAESYERSAEDFDDGNGRKPVRAAMACERAAQWREKRAALGVDY